LPVMLDGWVSGSTKPPQSYLHAADEPAGDRLDPGGTIS